MKRTDKRLRVCVALLICNLVFIWGNSLLPGEVSAAFSDWVKTLLANLFPGDGPAHQGTGLLRKIAHFSEFCTLGMCLCWLFGMLGRKKVWPFFWGGLAACIDETIQCFVPDRGSSIRDVLLDSGGVLTGMLLLYLGHTILKKRKTNRPCVLFRMTHRIIWFPRSIF